MGIKQSPPLWEMTEREFERSVRCSRWLVNQHPIEYACVLTVNLETLEIVKSMPPRHPYVVTLPEVAFVRHESKSWAVKREAYRAIIERAKEYGLI